MQNRVVRKDIMIVVVRYFGGIKLGAGGLTRAYGQAAQAVMEGLKTEQEVPKTEIQVTCDFSQEQPLRH
ncbi:MAG: YigZ family protein, partial [Pseudomonadota bacterium]|nr:YigZ family protein [Pseudomonadota bacterium]